MPVQQIVYHLLRYFIKTERLTDCADNSGAGTLSNYHIKTLMLWACELKPRSWWTENLNLVRICVELLNTLSVWLSDIRCPHYFISNCNLLDNSFNVGSVASTFMSIDEKYLSVWFVNNYIAQCAQLCPVDILRLFDDAQTSVKLQNATSQIVRWRVYTSLYDLWCTVHLAEANILGTMSQSSLTARQCIYWMKELAKIDKRFPIYCSAVALLHVAHKISRNGLNDELMNIIRTVLGPNFSRCFGDLSLNETELNTSDSDLVELLQKSAVEHLTTYRQLMAPDFASVVTIVTTDFEALYVYKRGDYQRCLQLSTQNVHTLLYADRVSDILTHPQFIQLLDDDIVSLAALVLLVKYPEYRPQRKKLHFDYYTMITQLTLSLYLMTQCQLQLRCSVTTLTQTLGFVKHAKRTYPPSPTVERLTLRFIERKVHRTLWPQN